MNDRQLVVMLDLENTIIDSWNHSTPLPKKCGYIAREICKLNNPIFGIFSSAIDNEEEKITGMVAAQSVMGLSIDPNFVPSFQDMQKLLPTTSFQKWEVMNVLGKQGLFLLYTAEHPELDFILFDDALPHEVTTVIRDGQTVQLRRV